MKVPCAGGFLITDNVLGLKELFGDVKVPTFSCYDEFESVVDYYLFTKENERKDLTLAMQNVIINNHTYFDRMSQLLEYLGESEGSKHILHKKVEFLNVS